MRLVRIGSTLAATALCVGALAASSCGGDSGNDPNAHVVHIASVETSPETIQCRTFIPGTPVPREIYFNIRMVNTRSDTVRVTRVSTTGITTNAHDPALVGQFAFVKDSLTFSPVDAILRPNDGEVTYTAILAVNCFPGGTAVPDFIDIQLTLRVRTTIGEYAAIPVTIHQAYQ
jgi:hypothetical protein